MTGQALYYLGETDLAHKVLAIAEEEGASARHLRLEAARLRRAAVDRGGGQGPGDRAAHHPHLRGDRSRGPAHDDDRGRAGRGAGQPAAWCWPSTRAAPRPGPSRPPNASAETIEGLVATGRAGRAGRPARQRPAAAVPGGGGEPARPRPQLQRPGDQGRRDNAKYLGLIRAVALAHQHQRAQTGDGRRTAPSPTSRPPKPTWPLSSRLCASVLGTTTDEMSPATRRLLDALEGLRHRAWPGRVHQAGAAGRHRPRRHPAEGPPGPIGRPRVRGGTGPGRPPPTSSPATTTPMSRVLRPIGRGQRAIGPVRMPIGRLSVGFRVVVRGGQTTRWARVNPSDPELSAGIGRVGESNDPTLFYQGRPLFCPIGPALRPLRETGAAKPTSLSHIGA